MIKRNLTLLFLLLGAFTLASCEKEESVPAETVKEEATPSFVDKIDRSDEGYVLVWNDEFDGDSLDTTKWCMQHGNGSDYGIENWGNNELESYEYDNVTVKDGNLVIEARKEDKNGKQFTSGRLRTMTDDNEPLYSVKYGRIEAKIKIEGGSGMWPAFWMLPVDQNIYGTWAASGEIDIMEAMGRLPFKIGGTAHYGGVWPKNVYSNKEYFFENGTDISDYHTYAVEWTPKHLKWYVDDECYSTLSNWYAIGDKGTVNYTAPAPFDVPFYIILNLAVGGSFDPKASINDESFPAAMYVDFVRVFQLEEGYDESIVKAAYNTAVKKDTGHHLYNETFDEGAGRLAFWNTENLDASVPSFETDADGVDHYVRSVKLHAGDADGRLYQTGLLLRGNYKYGVMFDMKADNESVVEIVITDSSGNIINSKEITVPKVDNPGKVKYTFENTESEDDENAVFSIYVKAGGNVTIDNIVFQDIEPLN
jgi:beta-glucanase (GH16 family)